MPVSTKRSLVFAPEFNCLLGVANWAANCSVSGLCLSGLVNTDDLMLCLLIVICLLFSTIGTTKL